MFRDGRRVEPGSQLTCDLCIIGAGAAGIALAREYMDGGAKVLLLESGGLDLDGETQGLYDGPQDGVPYPSTLDSSRLRYFGGTTNHWSAFCAPWKASDFEKRDWMENSGWPISLSDISPYYKRAFDTCRLQTPGEWEWDSEYWAKKLGASDPLKGSTFEARVSQQPVAKYDAEPFSFGRYFHSEFDRENTVDVLLNANVVSIDPTPDGRKIDGVKVATLSGNRFSVRAGVYVLATGGVENARVMLASGPKGGIGIGNEHGNVGRYFIDHIYPSPTAEFYPSESSAKKFRLYALSKIAGGRVFNHVGTPDDFLERERMNDSYIALRPQLDEDYVDASEAEGVEALNEMLDSISQGKFPDRLGKKAIDLLSDADDVALSLFRKLYYGKIPITHYDCMVRVDPTPMRESRISLAEELDPLGMPRARLTWAVHQNDRVNVRRLVEKFGEEVARLGVGRVKVLFDPDKEFPEDTGIGWHHMGTTRMSEDPRNGVVDKNCKVHSIDNLYVAGSSVFATSGSGTPTMTIVALALRLSDHLKNGWSLK
jgi:choline dehydrogenase-like flavoprotein